MLAVRRWPVDPLARHVGMVIASHANRYGRAWPSWATLIDETGYGRSTVARAIGRLEAAELLEVIHRSGRNCEYLFPQAADPSRSDTHPSRSGTDPSRSDTRSLKAESESRKAGAGRPRRLTAAADAEPIHIAGALGDRLEAFRRRAAGG